MQQSAHRADIPRRHGANIHIGRRMGRSMRLIIRGNPEPSEARWQHLGRALMHGDPPMDRLVQWMQEYSPEEGRTLFRQALNQGIESVRDAPDPLREFFAHVDRRPAWVDDDLLARGMETIHMTSLTGQYVLRDAALMGGYRAAAINKTLVLTGNLGRGPQRRLAETAKWWLDCTEPGGMNRFGEGFRNTLHVRFMHAMIRRRVSQMPEWDSKEWGLPINQSDMAATQLGFSVIFLMGCRAMGIPLTRDDGHAVMHLWRYIGWLMGVDECWLTHTENAGRTLLYQILMSQAPPDETSRQLGRALMNEPLQRHYLNLFWLRGHYNRARHLSIARLFLGLRGMRDLGLPWYVVPWYPMLALPMNLARHAIRWLSPNGRDWLVRSGRKAQTGYLQVLFGATKPRIHSPASTEAGWR